ncbi:MAG TPA: histidine ammonia-lyase [Bacillota bacterium]|jgi:histidine ammonia-lyase|nr:histidine ammonia-lyase [Bacillota bacterium]HOA35076.1 histidine ammonia-lyase [Bacillota bacterium]HOL14738.1 histidine ammonia-lyase [Bacillota bacterium]HPZ11224.1 histidine ammonia-lyase [Bacillota bacterium]HQE09347.1 histidine ammonia-lyase [Bacillota bacterium]
MPAQNSADKVLIDGENLTLEQILAVARRRAPVALHPSGREKLLKSRAIVENILAQEKVVYGVTTGFGRFSDVLISREDSDTLQENIIMSHACGVGEPLPHEVVRAMMLLRANSLTKGFSGVRIEVVELLLNMLNKEIHPVVPGKGSVGASGDLIPLAHIALAMIGLGEVEYCGKPVSSKEALQKAGLRPLKLTAKEGLALINGTQYMSALGSLAFLDAIELFKSASIAAAMTFEALEGIVSAFDPKVHELRPHGGQRICAAMMLKLLQGSDLLTRREQKRIQDAYTLRCIPQVHGATLDALKYTQGVLEIEINSATDNPLIFPESGEVISCGNFHGQPLALALDFLAIAVNELGNISERRIERLVNPALNNGLPAFLTENGGLNSGLMLLQYAAAALVSEGKVLAHPASVDSIPTSGNQEDHVSMGSIAAYKGRQVVRNIAWVIAAELLAAARAMRFISHRPGLGSGAAFRLLSGILPQDDGDRILYKDLQSVYELMQSGRIVREVEEAAGSLLPL